MLIKLVFIRIRKGNGYYDWDETLPVFQLAPETTFEQEILQDKRYASEHDAEGRKWYYVPRIFDNEIKSVQDAWSITKKALEASIKVARTVRSSQTKSIDISRLPEEPPFQSSF